MSAPLALTGISNFLSGAFMVVTPGVQAPVNRIKGYDAPLALNPNDLALLLNLMIPLGMALFLSSAQVIGCARRLLTLVALAAVAVILTFSRAGFLTLAVMFAIYLWKLRRRPEAPWMWGALVLALACAPLLPSGYADRLSTIVDVEVGSDRFVPGAMGGHASRISCRAARPDYRGGRRPEHPGPQRRARRDLDGSA